MKTKPRIGIIGLGQISVFHLDAIKQLQNTVELFAVSDVRKEMEGKFKEKFYSDYEKLLELKEIDGVIVSVPNQYHYEVCLKAIKKRKHILCEKPLTTDCKNSLDLVKKTPEGRVFQVGYMKRFHAGFKKAKQMLPSLGRIYQAHFRIFSFGEPFSRTGEFLVASGSHHLDLIRFYFGDVKLERSRVMKNRYGAEYLVRALFTSPKGEDVELEMGFVDLPNFGPGFLPGNILWNEEVEIIGTKGFVKVGNPAWTGASACRVDWWLKGDNRHTVHLDSYEQWKEQMKSFVRGIQNKKVYGAGVEDGYKVDCLINNIYKMSE